MTIPKIIHQTVPDKNKLDDLFSNNIAKLQSINRHWHHRLYDDSDCRSFIANCCGSEMLKCYDRINPAYGPARADLFRYLLLYEHGGVYLDIKSTVDSALDDVLRPDDVYLLSQWRNRRGQAYEGWGLHQPSIDSVKNEYQQWHIVASAKHPFLEAVIAKVQRNIDKYNPFRDGVGKSGVIKLTGPVAYTSAIRPILERYDHTIVDIEDMGFRYSIAPPTTTNKYGHVELFASHYTTLSEPIVKKKEYSGVEGLVIRNLHQYSSAYRGLRRRIKKSLDRSGA
jgi:mannosyltransferase OCH1-like enzyme